MERDGKPFFSYETELGTPAREVFERLSRLVMNNEVLIGRDISPSDPDGGTLAVLTPHQNPLNGGQIELELVTGDK